MDKTIAGLVIALTLLIGLAGGFYLGKLNAPTNEVIVEKNVTVIEEVPVEVEVIQEVEKDYLAIALEQFIIDLDLDKYQELSNVKTSDDFTVNQSKDGYIVEFGVDYKVTDTLNNTRSLEGKWVEVSYDAEDDEFTVNSD